MASKNARGSKRQFSDSEASDEEVATNGFHKEDEDNSSFDDEQDESDMDQDIESEDDDDDDDDDSDVEVGSSSQDEAETGSDSENNSDSCEEKEYGKESSLTPATDEFDKAKAVTSQLRFWENLLKMRVNLQKAMVIINQLPQCERLHELVSEAGKPCQQSLANGRGCLKRLLDQLFEIETVVLAANPETKHLVTGDSEPTNDDKSTALDNDDEEITSESEAGSESEKDEVEASSQHKQNFKRSQYPQFIAKRHKAYEKYRNSTIQKWADKTQSLSKFAAFDQSVAKQIQQTLTDRSRLVARTRVNRLGNRVLGKVSPIVEIPAAETDTAVASAASIDQDEEIFDDNDFYHHILREFIQYKNSYDPIVLTKQWLEIQQYRKKAKKNVDRKASKGRKTRYNVHKPLINFMAPITSPDSWTNDQRDDLFKNLFGKALTGAI